MSRIALGAFKGRIPDQDIRKLPDGNASVATNCKFEGGNLQSLAGLRRVHTFASTATIRSIYRWAAKPGADLTGRITTVENTTPIRIHCAERHGLIFGEKVYVSNTGIAAIDDKTWTITPEPSSFVFTLDNSVASGRAEHGQWTKENGTWFTSIYDNVDFVRSPIAGDTSQITFYTGTDRPRYTTNALATKGGGGVYPTNSFWLGLPQPKDAPVCTVNQGAAGDPSLTVTRAYLYAYVDSNTGPGPVSKATVVTVGENDTVTISLPLPVTAHGHNITHKRIYRAVTDASGAGTYFLVAQVEASKSEYHDISTDAAVALNEVLNHATWFPPPADLKGLSLLSNGVLVGYRGNTVCPSEPYSPHAFDPLKRVALPLPVRGLGAFDTNVVAFTDADAYLIAGPTPDAWSNEPMNLHQGCVSIPGIVSLGSAGVVFPSPDGLILVGPNGARNLTLEFFSKKAWQALNPETLRGFLWDGRYVGFYSTKDKDAGFVFDPTPGGLGWVDIDIHARGGHHEGMNDALYLIIGDHIEMFDGDDFNLLTKTWTSGEYDAGEAQLFTVGRVHASKYNGDGVGYWNLTVKLYLDGKLHLTKKVSANTIFRVPPVRARYIKIEVEGNAEVRLIEFASSVEELKAP
jgi:hypothetical protein